MRCPRDGQFLENEVFCGVEIDSCSYCDGTWLDEGETAKIVGMDTDIPDGEEIKLELLTDRTPGEVLKCPRDGTALKAFYFTHSKKIVIDKCPTCKGIWLDTDELKKIIHTAYNEYGG